MSRKLSKRLSAIADMVDKGAYLADVGSDHALLPIELVERGTIDWAMAIDNKIGPFLRMKEAVDQKKLSAHIICSKSDGISEINESVDTLAICGMGGLLAIKILEEGKRKLPQIKSIILDPHRDLVKVRTAVVSMGFKIQDETLVYEDKIHYVIMKFVKGTPTSPYTYADILLGPILRQKREPLFLEWLEIQRKHLSDLLNKNLSGEARQRYLALYRVVRDELRCQPSLDK